MDKGRILKVGSHHELLETSQEYRRIYNLQYNMADNGADTFVADIEGTDGRR